MTTTTRRALIKGAAATAAVAALPIRASAQGEPLKFGVLTPLTGAGGHDGPRMLKAMQAVIDEVNKAGGVLGRKIEPSSRTIRPIPRLPCAPPAS